MFKKIAAIDIGSTSVKVTKAEQKLKSLNIISLSSEPVDKDLPRFEALKNAVANLSEKEPLDGYTVICNIPMDMVTLRNLDFPFSDVSKISDVIQFEAEDKLPYSINETVYDFQLLKSAEETRTLFAAAEITNFNEVLSIFRDSGITVANMTIDSNALFECFRHFHITNYDTIQVDFGHSKTVVNYISMNELLFTRSIAIGMVNITEMISEILNISSQEAESLYTSLQIDLGSIESNYENEIYKSYKISKPKFAKILKGIQEVYDEILTEIRLTEKNINIDSSDSGFSEIVISGGGAITRGIEDYISEVTGIRTARMEFLSQFNDIQIRTRFCISFGLILSFLDSRTKNINFVSNGENGRFSIPDLHEYRFPLLLTGIAVFILLFSLAINSVFGLIENRKNDTLLRSQYKKYFQTELKKDEDPVQTARNSVAAVKKELNSIKSILPSDVSVIRKIQNLTENFENDDTFNLTELTIDEKTVKINGETGNSQNIDIFKNNLQKSGLYESVTLNTNMSTGKITKFTIQIKLKQTK